MSLRLLSFASFISLAWSWGLCNDMHQHCAAWAKDGQCNAGAENENWMLKQCAHSCQTCHLLCRDIEDSCAAWATDGHCESNPRFMLKECPTSCGVCAVKCHDKSKECGAWARSGECDINPSIRSTCPVSCGICTDLCLDKSPDCPNWAEAGECAANRAHMLKECPRSCNVCGDHENKHDYVPATCANKDQQQCMLWGEHECANNPEAMLTDCPQLCGACTLACVDKNADCRGWAKSKGGKACELDAHLPSLCTPARFERAGPPARFVFAPPRSSILTAGRSRGRPAVVRRLRGGGRAQAARQGRDVIAASHTLGRGRRHVRARPRAKGGVQSASSRAGLVLGTIDHLCRKQRHVWARVGRVDVRVGDAGCEAALSTVVHALPLEHER